MQTKAIVLFSLLFFGAPAAGWGQQATKVDYSARSSWLHPASDRLLFPRNFLRGYTEAGYFPAHNEIDMGRCSAGSGNFGGANAPCAAFGRYFMGGYAEIQPFGRKVGPLPLNRFYLFFEPRGFFGNNVPQYSYSQSFYPISFERSVGVIIALRKNLEVRVWQHQNDWLGRYKHWLGPADLLSNGPYGQYAGISTRWYFGGWGRQH
jgi:hypothetical protein